MQRGVTHKPETLQSRQACVLDGRVRFWLLDRPIQHQAAGRMRTGHVVCGVHNAQALAFFALPELVLSGTTAVAVPAALPEQRSVLAQDHWQVNPKLRCDHHSLALAGNAVHIDPHQGRSWRKAAQGDGRESRFSKGLCCQPNCKKRYNPQKS